VKILLNLKAMKFVPLLLLLGLSNMALAQIGLPVWTNRYNGPVNGHDYASAVAVDSNGNVFVTGRSAGTNTTAFATIKYSGAGVALWTNRYDATNATAVAEAVDTNGNVIVTGYIYVSSTNNDFATIKYSSAGVPQWTNRFTAGTAGASAIAVDTNGNVFVTGTINGGAFATIKYSSLGSPRWTNRYTGGAGGATYIAVDTNGDAVVTGTANLTTDFNGPDYATIKYSGATGAPLWTNLYDSGAQKSDYASAVAVDASANVYVTGASIGLLGNYEYATIKYTNGVAAWIRRYSRAMGNNDKAKSLAVDNNGKVFVTGTESISGGTNQWYATIAYAASGVSLWTNFYSGGYGYAQPGAVALDGGGNVFVTGFALGTNYFDYATLKYSGAGALLWTNCYNGPGSTNDLAMAMAVDGVGNVFVTGYSTGTNGLYNYATIKYSGVPLPSPFRFGCSQSTNGIRILFTNTPGAQFSVLAATNLALPMSNWPSLGDVIEVSPGQFQFTDSTTTNTIRRFYRIRSP
jgi:hypothetical protein